LICVGPASACSPAAEQLSHAHHAVNPGRISPQIEHRLWSFVSHNWRGKPLISYEVIVSLIGATTTRAGLEVYARLDQRDYPKGIEVSNAELAAVNLTGDRFHPEWNYTIVPGAP